MDDYPNNGELVIATVERVQDHGAFVHLDEYGNKQGMVSIREFSQKWVKNPRDYLKEGQKAVLKVQRVNPEREHIDLSLKAVNDNERRNKLKEFKLNIRIEKLMEYLAKEYKKKPEELYKLFGDKLIEDYGGLYDAFAEVANDKEDLKSYIADDKFRAEVIKNIQENIKPTFVSIKGYISLFSEAGDGLDIVKVALQEGEKALPKELECKITYVAPPNYRIDIISEDYKSAEKAMKTCYDAIEKYASSKGAQIEFSKKLIKAA
jgi:translation initiation factor 2 subunit 1